MVRTDKRTPKRRCIGCGKRDEKSAFVRIVAGKDGSLFLDLQGKAEGRGAYLCRDAACLEKAKKRHVFSGSFRRETDNSCIAGLEADFLKVTETQAQLITGSYVKAGGC